MNSDIKLQLKFPSEAIHQRILLHNNLIIVLVLTKLLYSKMLKPINSMVSSYHIVGLVCEEQFLQSINFSAQQ